MVKATRTPPPALATLAEEKSNFTAEGSPPPGKVSTSKPATAHDAPQTVPATKAPMRGNQQVEAPLVCQAHLVPLSLKRMRSSADTSFS
jgi:hypothetical protein